jgi:hypothetical protein
MSNPWVIFEKLITKTKRTIAQVITTNATTGRVNILQVGDDSPIYVESNGSSYANGSYVFIEGGVIVGQAPNVREITTEFLT